MWWKYEDGGCTNDMAQGEGPSLQELSAGDHSWPYACDANLLGDGMGGKVKSQMMQVWWCVLVALKRLRQEDQEFKASRDHIKSSMEPAGYKERLFPKKQRKETKWNKRHIHTTGKMAVVRADWRDKGQKEILIAKTLKRVSEYLLMQIILGRANIQRRKWYPCPLTANRKRSQRLDQRLWDQLCGLVSGGALASSRPEFPQGGKTDPNPQSCPDPHTTCMRTPTHPLHTCTGIYRRINVLFFF